MTAPALSAAPALVDAETIRAYSAWLSKRAAIPGFDPYYSAEALRFELGEGDVLFVPGDLTVSPAPCGVLLGSARAAASLTVCGIGRDEAAACVGAIDGVRTAGEARAASAVAARAWDLLVANTFGKLVFAPVALAALEARVSHAEIVRFPGSPYEIVRAYWHNMADVAERLAGLDAHLADTRGFIGLIRELNVISLVGASRRSFYRPASPVVAKQGLEPGALWHTPPITQETSEGTRFVSGPRVGAALIGGDRYHGLLSTSVADPESLAPTRSVTTNDGLPWGRLVTARAAADERAAPWFCPPRPFDSAHFEAIRVALGRALAAARQGRNADAARSLAAAHFRFVRLHPFTSGNQSVAMGLVNAVLREAFGAGIPHLVLDHLALRLSPSAYEEIFARAVHAWLLVDENPVRRALELAARRRRLFSFLEALRAARDEEIAGLVAAREADARLALLFPPRPDVRTE
jgi:hypothetical protein